MDLVSHRLALVEELHSGALVSQDLPYRSVLEAACDPKESVLCIIDVEDQVNGAPEYQPAVEQVEPYAEDSQQDGPPVSAEPAQDAASRRDCRILWEMRSA